MAQENPADTAGPSSPPPRLPEGWLPQWEGVQRKWYYVQRATGKSQWEIPTEPVVLSPSTTPTSIGTGPSQAPPSRPSTNSPQVSGYRRTDEQLESVAQNSRNFSSLDSQSVRQSGYPSYGASDMNWYTEQTGHFSAYNNGPAYDTGQNQYGAHGSAGNTVPGVASLYPGHSHLQGSMGPSLSMRDKLRTAPDNSSNMIHGYPGMDGTDRSQYQDHGFPPEHTSSVPGDRAGHQLQWQTMQQPVPSNARTHLPSSQPGPSVLSEPLYGTYAAPRSVEGAPGTLVTRSLRSADLQQKEYAAQHAPFGATIQSSSHIYPSSSTSYSQYHSTSMGRTQSGPGGDALGFPATPDTQGNAQDYRNPLVQAGIQHYIPQQHAGYPSSGRVQPGSGHPRQADPSSSHQGQWHSTTMPLRTATSDPQFVSGPWASSTPPRGDPARAPRYD